MDKAWLPTGAHHDLNFERHLGHSIGPMTGGGWKGVIHITVSPWIAVDSMISVLKAKGAEPQLVIGGRAGFNFPVLAQMLALTDAGKALRHPSGPETNRANAVQMEICARPGNVRSPHRGEEITDLFTLPDVELPDEILKAAAKAANGSESHAQAALEDLELCMHENSEMVRAFNSGVAGWTDDTYKALGNAWYSVKYRLPIPTRQARSFQNTKRLTGAEWVKASGYLGHMHCPGNDHIDPTTAFQGRKLTGAIKRAPRRL